MNIVVEFLGIAQDAGIPQIGCTCKICSEINAGKRKAESPVALGITNKKTGRKFIIEATPDFSKQYNRFLNIEEKEQLSGIILTHAHIGHYTGLMFLGREALNTKKLKVFSSDKMEDFLKENAPWNQLIKLENIDIVNLIANKKIEIDEGLFITAIEVKHRNEYADTYGFLIEGDEKIFFLPDIDSWNGFENELETLIKECKKVILDATFFIKEEIGNIRGRNINEIPHPTVLETISFVEARKLEPNKIIFTHFNHTNLLLHDDKKRKEVLKRGFLISEEGMKIEI
ncbi:MBL fold metallo-hydrolase [Fusobacterium necrophorum]|uniref:Coenzyme PQQ biosynthesis protein B n=2 Tax=Fusobacterium necrophorum TaxID=859 RepID=A0AB73C346_9FUSO|nr:MBL fold metallo-hydrolase [Fusobacterium necrophorum]KDE61976.1 coenzyme PQQ biosynthesis protein B [Fusobacterium necrophorum BFTR-1]KDE70040.1 coenzyme PQQ biosynthesis protein B [Fusobacterium necrophorum DAB]KDE72328.1 coenzyme PQQ biosynthesis protein B [Fusobacterium necrophorum DJ-2]MBR8734273.1 Coenzyme PQQ synthesis protein B [Fusobacterium necrophorum]MBR8790449.1 Coenzyme PQQ synthesis protein B [Fusobacterium necrophorum]